MIIGLIDSGHLIYKRIKTFLRELLKQMLWRLFRFVPERRYHEGITLTCRKGNWYAESFIAESILQSSPKPERVITLVAKRLMKVKEEES
jgi:hypothetical protein